MSRSESGMSTQHTNKRLYLVFSLFQLKRSEATNYLSLLQIWMQACLNGYMVYLLCYYDCYYYNGYIK